MFKVAVYNAISEKGLSLFTADQYTLNDDVSNADALVLRSAKLHDMVFPDQLKVIGRAGAGTNNIPVEKCTELGIPVLNTPGANANAVKELVLTGMLLAYRNICSAWDYLRKLEGDESSQYQLVEKNKKQFVGMELPGKRLAVIGLGNIGVEVANSARNLGMEVVGYDPGISVANAWKLRSSVKQAESLVEAVATADFISIHVPLIEATTKMVNTDLLTKMKAGVVLLNFARGEIVCQDSIRDALLNGHLRNYVCDFPVPLLKEFPQVISLPHLGASTQEAQENCAIMVAEQVKSFLVDGHIKHSVNFPDVRMARSGTQRITIINKNIPSMVAQITSVISHHKLNIVDMINKSKGDVAYTIVDIDGMIGPNVVSEFKAISGLIKARVL